MPAVDIKIKNFPQICATTGKKKKICFSNAKFPMPAVNENQKFFPQICATTGEKKKSLGGREFEDWFASHQEDCRKNFSGSAGAMEVEAAKVLWGRSLERNLRYTAMISTCISFYKFVYLKSLHFLFIFVKFLILVLYLKSFYDTSIIFKVLQTFFLRVIYFVKYICTFGLKCRLKDFSYFFFFFFLDD